MQAIGNIVHRRFGHTPQFFLKSFRRCKYAVSLFQIAVQRRCRPFGQWCELLGIIVVIPVAGFSEPAHHRDEIDIGTEYFRPFDHIAQLQIDDGVNDNVIDQCQACFQNEVKQLEGGWTQRGQSNNVNVAIRSTSERAAMAKGIRFDVCDLMPLAQFVQQMLFTGADIVPTNLGKPDNIQACLLQRIRPLSDYLTGINITFSGKARSRSLCPNR